MSGLTFSTNMTPPAKIEPLLHPKGNAYDLAVSSWLDVQLLLAEYREREREEERLWERILNGRLWMQRHDEQHPRHEHNTELLACLEWDRQITRFQMLDRLQAIRVSVWSVWVCWQAMSGADQAPLRWETGLEGLEGPQSIWERLDLQDVEMGELPITERRSWLTDDAVLAEWERNPFGGNHADA